MKAMKWIRCIALSVVLIFNAVTMIPAYAAENVPQEVLDMRKSVVRVECEAGEDAFSGSGFAIGTEEPVSYIVTNYHVIEDADVIKIMRSKDSYIKAKIAVQLPFSDLCVLKLDKPIKDIPPFVLSDEKIAEAGEAVYSLGFPGAADTLSDSATGKVEDVTMTDGIISSVKSFTRIKGSEPVQLLQINAAVNPGNSGGPLLNKKGQVVGINSYNALNAENINGSISVLELVEVLKQNGIPYKSSLEMEQDEKQAALKAAEQAKEQAQAQTEAQKAEQTKESPFDWAKTSLIAGAVLVVIVLVIAFALIIKRSKKKSAVQGVKLEAYLEQWGGRLPFEMSIQILTPIFKQLASYHAQRLIHLDICPERIMVMNTTQGHLMRPNSVQENNRLILNTGFAAPEQYQPDGKLGPWTDVYSICAVLFFMVTGKRPQGMLQRKLEEDSVSNVLEGMGLSSEHKAFIEKGLAVTASDRIQTGLELLGALGIDYDPNSLESQMKHEDFSGKHKSKFAKSRVKKVALITAAALAVVVSSVLIGGSLIVQHHYESALSYVDEHKYEDAYEEWKKIPVDYKNSEKLGQYIFANIEIEYKNFKKAKSRFAELGSYRDSNKMNQEVDYQEALFLLKRLDYDKAKAMFEALGAYKDSKTKLLEMDYQQALDYMNKQDYKKAEQAFESLADRAYLDSKEQISEVNYRWAQAQLKDGLYAAALSKIDSVKGYKDSAAIRTQMVESIYKKGVEEYRKSAIASAYSCFYAIDPFKDSKTYLTLLEAKALSLYDIDAYKKTKAVYDKLKKLETFEDTKEIMVNNVFIYYRLEGVWRVGGDYLSLKYDEEGGGWYMINSLPSVDGPSFKLEDGAIHVGSNEKGWKKAFDLKFTSADRLTLFCVKNNRTYHFRRK